MLGMDQIQRLIPADTDKLILPAHTLWASGEARKPLRTIGKRTRVLLCT